MGKVFTDMSPYLYRFHICVFLLMLVRIHKLFYVSTENVHVLVTVSNCLHTVAQNSKENTENQHRKHTSVIHKYLRIDPNMANTWPQRARPGL